MEIKFKAASDGRNYIPLTETADTTVYKHVDEFLFVLKPSTVLSIAEADAIISSISPTQLNGMRSTRAEERLWPVGYAKVHITEMHKNGEQVKPITFEVLYDLGLTVLSYIHSTAEGSGADFLKEAPSSTGTVGATGTATNSKTSAKS